jgi:hypothetical protein
MALILRITVNRFNYQPVTSPIFILRLSLTHDTEIDVLTSLGTEELFIP